MKTAWWCLRDREGNLVPDTFAPTKEQCWFYSFPFVAATEGEGWQTKYWKRGEASMKWALRHGWSLERVLLVKVTEADKKWAKSVFAKLPPKRVSR